MAQSGRSDHRNECLVSGVKRTSRFERVMSGFDPKRTLPERRFDHFQPASLTRYDALVGALGAGNAAT
jgi:hypothetical protein